MRNIKKRTVRVSDLMQSRYVYECVAQVGKNFDARFVPELSPKDMLALGVFGGRYMRDCVKEFPREWFVRAKFHPKGKKGHSKELNYFQVDASQSLAIWKKKGWIHPADPRGWFQWYCRYYVGRRIPEEDDRQIKRWVAMKRHVTQLQRACKKGDVHCQPRRRQALLHWAYDSRAL